MNSSKGSSLNPPDNFEVRAVLEERVVDRHALASDIEGLVAELITNADSDLEDCDRRMMELNATVDDGRRVPASVRADRFVLNDGFHLVQRRLTVLIQAG